MNFSASSVLPCLVGASLILVMVCIWLEQATLWLAQQPPSSREVRETAPLQAKLVDLRQGLIFGQTLGLLTLAGSGCALWWPQPEGPYLLAGLLLALITGPKLWAITSRKLLQHLKATRRLSIALLRLLAGMARPLPGWLVNNRLASASAANVLQTHLLASSAWQNPGHRSMLLNLLGLDRITVDDVMTPRQQIEAINLELPDDELHQQLATSHHTRLPVYRDTPDNILGFVHVRKVLHMSLDRLTAERLLEIMRPPYFIPSGTPLLAQLQLFQENHRRMGVVVDEYGEIQGLLTLDDILEELVGEFSTSAHNLPRGVEREANGDFLLEGGCLIRDLNRKLGTDFPLDGPKTLNGLIIDHFQDIPEVGTCMKIRQQGLEIVQTHDRSVKTIRLYAKTMATRT